MKIFIQVVLTICFIISLSYLVLGGFRWITSGGDKSNIEGARDSIIAALIGLLFLSIISLLVFFFLPPLPLNDKSTIEITLAIFIDLALFRLILGLMKWITSKSDQRNVKEARSQVISSLGALFPLSATLFFIFFFFPSININNTVKATIEIILTTSLFINFLYMLYGSLKYILSGGDPVKVLKARLAIMRSVLILSFLALISLLAFFFFPPLTGDAISIISLVISLIVVLLWLIILAALAFNWLSVWNSDRKNLRTKKAEKKFDVFISYNRQDLSYVVDLADQLQKQGILPWLDVREVSPGRSWQTILEEQFTQIKSAAVCVGEEGIGPWQQLEIEAFLREFLARGCPVIPVLLPNAKKAPQLPLFLRDRTWVDLHGETAYTIHLLRQAIEGKVLTGKPSGLAAPSLSIKGFRTEDESGLETLPSVSQEAELRASATEVRLAINNYSYREYQKLSKAIIQLIGATNPQRVQDLPYPEERIVWEIHHPLSPVGLQLETEQALLFLRGKEEPDVSFYKSLIDIKNSKHLDILLVVDFLPSRTPPPLFDPRVVWIRSEHLEELIDISSVEVILWLRRLVASQIRDFDLLIRYRTEGPTDSVLFRGRELEIAQLMSSTLRGGIILGAHASGKTSLLDQIHKRLQEYDHIVSIRYSIRSVNFQTFFEDTLDQLSLPLPDELNMESWASILRTYQKKGKTPVLLLDEVDQLIEQDTKTGFHLGREMRALQLDGYCKFYLAGHARLRETIKVEGGPFQNFAEVITLKGLDEQASKQLIQDPIKAIGFTLNDSQASRISKGTAGVAVLIQHFCRLLLLHIHQERNSDIVNEALEAIEENPQLLNFVFDYYKYAQTWASMAITVIAAQSDQVNRKDILHIFTQYGVALTWDQLEGYLEFLVTFGVLKELKGGYYSLASLYLCKAIKIRTEDTDLLLISQLEKSKRNDDT